MKRFLFQSLRVGISLGLLYYLVSLTDYHKIITALTNVNTGPLVAAGATFLLSIVILAFRWRVLTRAYGLKSTYPELVVFYLIGLFFNNFLPTSIGGDLSRAYYLGQVSGDRAASIGTVFLERVIGLLATLSLAMLSLFWLLSNFNSNRILYFTLGVAAFLAIFVAMVMSRRLYNRLKGWISRISLYHIGERIIRVLDTLHFYRDKKTVLIQTFFLSLASQITLVMMNFILARAIGINEVPLGYFFLVVPVTFVFSLMPSINGIGVRETGYVLLLNKYAVLHHLALSLSFLVTILPLLISIVGGILFMFYRAKGLEMPDLSEERL
ncbi:MAG: lysylphosphatidylglycerol synthase transmembrane domain-containing protein [Calditrichia bacterium]